VRSRAADPHRSEPGTQSGSSTDRATWDPPPPADPVQVGDLVDSVLGRISTGGPAAVLRLRANWRDVVGVAAAERSAPLSLEDGSLLVEVVDGATASLLRFETASIARKAADVCAEPVSTVRFRVRRPKT
jgi:hypothetical protein